MTYRLSMAAGALVLALTMTACHGTSPAAVTTVATMPEQTKSTLSAVQVQGGEELTKLLDQIEDNVFPGTAGCTLTAVRYTVNLLDWCKAAGVSDSELRSIISQWMQDKDPAELARKFELVMDTYQSLMGSNARDLLDSAGVETDSLPWPESCRQVMQTILETTGAEDLSNTAALEAVLEDIRSGWAGNRADTVRQAAMLLNWSANTPSTEAQIRKTLTDWLSPMGNDTQNAFAVSLARVGMYCQKLLSEERATLLKSAGQEDQHWPDTAIQPINILLDAAGASGEDGFLGLMNRIAAPEEEQTQLAYELLDWAQNTALSSNEIWELGRSLFYTMTDDRLRSFRNGMDTVSTLCSHLIEEADPDHPWTKDALDRILSLYTAAGLGSAS